ncbi:hypothetical protein HUJ04_000475 [Dendroctonus ponderosae]|nr:hypothetical protein HUJ04_000475 [Dendroctonus ponderosae]
MNIKNSPGPGNINIELLQAAPNVILNILAVIFNQCIEAEDEDDASYKLQDSYEDCGLTYLGVTLSSNGESAGDISNKKNNKKDENYYLQNDRKKYSTYVAETWEISNGDKSRMDGNRSPKIIPKLIPPERGQRERPPRSWRKDLEEAMEARVLQDGDWADRTK